MKKNVKTLKGNLQLFKALSSQTRTDILQLLIDNGPMNMTAIAEELNLTGGAITSHVKLLEGAGLIEIEKRVGKHGMLKVCSANVESFTVDIAAS